MNDRLEVEGAYVNIRTKTSLHTRAMLVVMLLASSVCATTRVAAQDSWDGPPFSVDAAKLYDTAAAQSVPESAEAVVVLDEERVVFEADGRSRHTWHLVYRVLTPDGVAGWSGVEARWEPWHQERPSIRARVITPDHVEHMLDSRTLVEAGTESHQPVFSDRRTLQGPLPAITVGAVVEEQIEIQEVAPLFDRGVVQHDYFARRVPVRRARLTIEAPASQPLQYVVHLLPSLEPKRTESGGRVRLVFESGAIEPAKDAEPFVPGDMPHWPHVAYSTGRSWKDVATRYIEIVDAQLASSDVQALLGGLVIANRTRPQIVEALVARLHQQVRYTGVEFGEASLVPRTPGETLKRKYGDCKDKAALLIAMLRAAGVPAYMALLNTAPGEDAEPTLPGMGNFDHAIVYAPGAPDLWVDATDEYARVATLPPGDQGRAALIARPETDRLTRTPEATSADNRTLETREFFLAELGPAHVVEASESWGTIEESYREAYGGPDSKQLRDQLDNYAKQAYLAEKLGSFDRSDARDFSAPFHLHLEMPHAKRGQTDMETAAVVLLPAVLVSRLPVFLRQDEQDSEESQSSSQAKAGKHRKADMVLLEPYTMELRYRIVPPPGFRLQPLPESGEQHLGPALFSKEFAQGPDGAVTARLRFDTVKRRFSPEETDALSGGARELEKTGPILITFEQAGQADLAAGKVREALDEFRKLVEQHPQEALHHSQVARALLVAGIGEAAREEARRAVELEPASANAYQTLGWVLEHDLVGRQFKKGFGPAGAEAAYRKALELDPTTFEARGNLAILLEHNARGERYGTGAKLDQAIKEYQTLQDKNGENNLSDNLLVALLWARRFRELKETIQKVGTSPTRQALILAATAAIDGTVAAIRDARRDLHSDDERSKALTEAGQDLLQVRLYSESADLLTAGAQGSQDSANVLGRAALLRNAHRHEDLAYPEDDPRSVVKKFFITLVSGELNKSVLEPFLSRRTREDLKLQPEEEFRRPATAIKSMLSRLGLPLDVVLDLALATMQLTADGDDSIGYRIRTQGLGAGGASNMVFYVVRDDGQHRILDASGDLDTLGEEALARLEAGNVAGARRLLDWAREDQRLGGGDDPLAGPAFPRFWTKGAAADRDAIRVAAANLIVAGHNPEKAVAILLEGRGKSTSDVARNSFDLALARAYLKQKKYADVLPLAERLAATAPESVTAFYLLSGALSRLQRWEDAEKVIQQRLQRLPDDLDATRAAVNLAEYRGRLDQALQLGRHLVEIGKAEHGDYNNLAWDALVQGNVTADAVRAAQRSNLLSQNANASELHTMAAVYAEIGKTSEAREALLESMDARGLEEPDGDSWYVFGRIAEQFGVLSAAVADYKKVQPPERKETLPVATYTLAQRRLDTIACRTESSSP